MGLKNNLKRLRENKGLSQEDLARLCGMSLSSYASIERGRSIPRLTTALRIAEALNEKVERLFSLKDLKK